MEGEYIYGNEVLVFTPCGSKETYWIDISGWVHEPLINYYKANTEKPYQSIYVSVRGHMHDEFTDGFAADYSGIFHISEVYSFAVNIPKECKKYNISR